MALLQFEICAAQSDDQDNTAEQSLGHYLLDISYSSTDSIDGTVEVFNPGFTWLVRPELRVGVSATFVSFNPGKNLEAVRGNVSSHNGLGDTVFFVQYDWQENLTASPWVPDNAGTAVAILAPTGNAMDFLGADMWATAISTSWPIEFDNKWLLNPAVSYTFSFGEGPLAVPVHIAEAGVGIVRVFPSKFWLSYTPILWYDFDFDRLFFDSNFTF